MNVGKYPKKILDTIFDGMERHKYMPSLMLILGIIFIMEGFIFIYSTWGIHAFSHLSLTFLLILISIGTFLLSIVFLYFKEKEGEIREIEEKMNMAPYLQKMDRYFHISNRWVSITIGILLISSIWLLTLLKIGNPNLGDSDILLILTGLMFIVYPFVPKKYSMERDFILTFFIFLLAIMAVIPFLFGLFAKDFTYYFLTEPLHGILNYIGIRNVLIPPATIRIMEPSSLIKRDITIARSCSGIYSFSIFTSAFISFVLVVYQKINRKSVLFLIVGIILAYLGNLLRMTVVILAGYHYGRNALEWTHANLGYLIFFAWMGVFWILLYRFLMKETDEDTGEK